MSLNKRYIKLIQGYSQDYDNNTKNQSKNELHIQNNDLNQDKKEIVKQENSDKSIKKHKNTMTIGLNRKNKFLEAIRIDENIDCYYKDNSNDNINKLSIKNDKTNQSLINYSSNMTNTTNSIDIHQQSIQSRTFKENKEKLIQIKEILSTFIENTIKSLRSNGDYNHVCLFSNYTQKEDLLLILIGTYQYLSEYVILNKDIVLYGLSIKNIYINKESKENISINQNTNKIEANHIEIADKLILNIKEYLSINLNNNDLSQYDNDIKGVIANLHKFYYEILVIGKYLNILYEKEVFPLFSLYFPLNQSRFCLLKTLKTIFMSYLLYDISIVIILKSSYSNYFMNYAREVKYLMTCNNEYFLMKSVIEEYIRVVFDCEYELSSKKDKKNKNKKKCKEKETKTKYNHIEEINFYEEMLQNPINIIYDYIKSEGSIIYTSIVIDEKRKSKDSSIVLEKQKKHIGNLKVCDCNKKDKDMTKDSKYFQFYNNYKCESNDFNQEIKFKDIDEIVDFINSSTDIKANHYDKTKSKSKIKMVSHEKRKNYDENDKFEDDKEVESFIKRLIGSSCHMENIEKLTVN